MRAWKFSRNKTRRNVFPDGASFVFSDTLGLVRSRTGRICITSITRRNTHALRLFSAWLRAVRPDEKEFPFTSISINCNYAARIHRDGNNAGPSMTASFGQFRSGRLRYWPDDDGSTPLEHLQEEDCSIVDSSESLVLFCGNRAHAVETFVGERYSAVFFNLNGFDDTPPNVREFFGDLDIPFPDVASARYFASLLAPPRGYDGRRHQQSIRCALFGLSERAQMRREQAEERTRKARKNSV